VAIVCHTLAPRPRRGELVREAKTTEFVKSGKLAYAADEGTRVEVRLDDLIDRARRHGGLDAEAVRTFARGGLLREAGFLLDADKRALVQMWG
jgi:hypothetical protein